MPSARPTTSPVPRAGAAPTSPARRSVAATLASNRLGLWPVFFFAVSAMTPLTVVATALPIGFGEVGETSVPVAYASMAVIMGLFAVGYVAMARRVHNAGAFYSYVARGLGRPLGVAAAGVALVAYNAIQVALYGAFGVAAGTVAAAFGAPGHWGLWALAAWLVIAVLGTLRVDLNARILGVLVLAEIAVVVTFDLVMVTNPAGGVVRFDTLDPSALLTVGGASLLVGATAGFVGAEAPAVYSEETKDPQRTVGRAVYLTLLLAGVLYAGSAWAASVAAGPDRIVDVARQHGSDLFFVLAAESLPQVVVDIGAVLFVTSLFAAMLAFHHTVARYTFALARERVLPTWMARTNAAGAPLAGSLLQSLLALGVLVGYLVLGLEPIRHLLFFGSVAGGLGILLLLTATSMAVVAFFAHRPDGEILWRRVVAPSAASLVLVVVLAATVAFLGELLEVTDPVHVWAMPVGYLVVVVAGLAWGLHLRSRRPDVYAGIGLGAHSTTAPRTPERRPARSAAHASGR